MTTETATATATSSGAPPTIPEKSQLDCTGLPEAPVLQAPAYILGLDGVDFADLRSYNAFSEINACKTLIGDAKFITDLNAACSRAYEFGNMLYTYRSVTKAFPSNNDIKELPPEQQAEYHAQALEVLEPEIQKLQDLYNFHTEAIDLFVQNIHDLAKKSDVISHARIWYIIRLLDSLSIVDALKDMKAAVKNDFGIYKRTFTSVKGVEGSSLEVAEQNAKNSNFLANHKFIINTLRTAIQEIDNYQEVVELMVNLLVEKYQSGHWITPDERHVLLRSLALSIYLLDKKDMRNPKHSYDAFKSKKIDINALSEIILDKPILPLFGDMRVDLVDIVAASPNCPKSPWKEKEAKRKANLEEKYRLVFSLEAARQRHLTFLAQFYSTLKSAKNAKNQNIPLAQCDQLQDLVVQGLHIVSDFTAAIQEQSAFNFHFITQSDTTDHAYELAVKCAYSESDLDATVEYISMSKEISRILNDNWPFIKPLISRFNHHYVQNFLMHEIREMIYNSNKKKRTDLFDTLAALRTIGIHWKDGKIVSDPAEVGNKAWSKTTLKIPESDLPLSVGQTYFIRNLVYSLIDERSALKKKRSMFKGAILKRDQIDLFTAFYNKTFFFRYTENFSQTLNEASDLSDLWYREFYLELTSEIQFPIHMSLPWILSEHAIKSKTSSLKDNVLYIFDLYNDAAHRAVHRFKSKFLFDEVEAEVTLSFIQLIFIVSKQIFRYLKTTASCQLISPAYRKAFPDMVAKNNQLDPNELYPEPNYFGHLLQQSHFELVGRTIDLRDLFSEHINTLFRQNVDILLRYFDSKSLCHITEVEDLFNMTRLAHSMAVDKYNLALDPWENIFNELAESTSALALRNRLVTHVIEELIYDVAPGMVFNFTTSRFIRPKKVYAKKLDRLKLRAPDPMFLFGTDQLAAHWHKIHSLTFGFFGYTHIQSLFRVIGIHRLPVILQFLNSEMQNLVQTRIDPFINALCTSMPKASLPPTALPTQGAFAIVEGHLSELLTYLRETPDPFEYLKELGNLLFIVRLFDHAIPTASSLLLQKAGYGAGGETADLTTLARGFSFFRYSIFSLKKLVIQYNESWGGETLSDPDLFKLDDSKEFYRVWSVLSFMFCAPTSPNPLDRRAFIDLPEESYGKHWGWRTFGHGFLFAGYLIMYILRQHHRFDVYDFGLHIRRMENTRVGKREPACTDPVVKAFMSNSREVESFNEIFLMMLNHHSPHIV